MGHIEGKALTDIPYMKFYTEDQVFEVCELIADILQMNGVDMHLGMTAITKMSDYMERVRGIRIDIREIKFTEVKKSDAN